MADRPDYRADGEIVEISGLSGEWKRMPDDIRYVYAAGSMTCCPICQEAAAGVPWGGCFICDKRGCCVALVDTGEVFVPLPDRSPASRSRPSARSVE